MSENVPQNIANSQQKSLSSGFVMLNRIGGAELLQEDPKAFLLLTQIALRARRKDGKYSRYSLKSNQALIGDHEPIGLSSQEYRSAKRRLIKHGLVVFEPINRGTIATLISADVYDINSDEEPSDSSMKFQIKEPSTNQPLTNNQPSNNLHSTTKSLVTRMKERKEPKKETTSTVAVGLYACLENCPSLTEDEKKSLMKHPENRVQIALEFSSKTHIKRTLAGLLHWHCSQNPAPQPPSNSIGYTPQQIAAEEYNRFLKGQGYDELVHKNQEAIAKYCLWIIHDGVEITVSLKNPLEILMEDIIKSKQTIAIKKDR